MRVIAYLHERDNHTSENVCEKNPSGNNVARIRESLEKDWFYAAEGSIVSIVFHRAEVPGCKKVFCILDLLVPSNPGSRCAVQRACITFSSIHLIPARANHCSFFFALFVRRFNRVPFHASRIPGTSGASRYMPQISRVRQGSLVYSTKDEFASPIFFLSALGYTLCAVLARLIIF